VPSAARNVQFPGWSMLDTAVLYANFIHALVVVRVSLATNGRWFYTESDGARSV